MDRLINTVDTALAVRDAAQTGTGQETQRAGDDTSLVANNITEEVAGDNNTVKLTGVLDHEHSSRVDQVVTNLDLRELLGHDLSDNLTPQTASSQDISLVQTPHGQRGVVLQSQVGGQAGDALDLGARVGLSVHGVARAVIFLALAEVDATSQLTDDVEVDTTADFGLQWRALDQRGRGEVAGTQVAECAHLLAQAQDTLLGTDSAGAPFLFISVLVSLLPRPVFQVCRVERTGPPIAPRSTASAFFAASRASSVKGDPVASMEAYF